MTDPFTVVPLRSNCSKDVADLKVLGVNFTDAIGILSFKIRIWLVIASLVSLDTTQKMVTSATANMISGALCIIIDGCSAKKKKISTMRENSRL